LKGKSPAFAREDARSAQLEAALESILLFISFLLSLFGLRNGTKLGIGGKRADEPPV
jgi:hypothetical protein